MSNSLKRFSWTQGNTKNYSHLLILINIFTYEKIELSIIQDRYSNGKAFMMFIGKLSNTTIIMLQSWFLLIILSIEKLGKSLSQYYLIQYSAVSNRLIALKPVHSIHIDTICYAFIVYYLCLKVCTNKNEMGIVKINTNQNGNNVSLLVRESDVKHYFNCVNQNCELTLQ